MRTGRRAVLAGLAGGLAALWGAGAVEAKKKPRARAAASARLAVSGSGAGERTWTLAQLGLPATARWLAVTGTVTLPIFRTCKVYIQDPADPRGTGVVMVDPGRRAVRSGVIAVRSGRVLVKAVGLFGWAVDVTLTVIG